MNINNNELIKKLNNQMDLKDEEYNQLIKAGKDEIIKKLNEFSSEEYLEKLLEYTTLGYLATEMEYADDEDRTLARSCVYMISALAINHSNYIKSLKSGDNAAKTLCRFNTINFLNEIKEIKNYDTLVDNLHDNIENTVNIGYNLLSLDDLQENMEELEDSRNKIKIYRNKYI